MRKLSIIIPVYNEEKTVGILLKRLISTKLPVKEIEYIVINDGSIDTSAKVISAFRFPVSAYRIIHHKKNMGKGAAVRSGLKYATGDYIIIQDADLEYNTKDITRLLKELKKSKKPVVYGTRLKRLPNFKEDAPFYLLHYFGNKFLSLVTSILYGHWLTDMECCYKLFPKEALKGMRLHARGFEFEPEITAKILKRGYRISEVSISTQPRSYKEGKKLKTLRDGPKALWTLLKYRFVE